MTTQNTQARRQADGYSELALWTLALLAAFAGYGWLVLQSFNSVGCEGICRDDLIFAPFAAYPWVIAGSFGIAIVVRIVLVRSRQRRFWAALLGLTLVISTILLTSALREVGYAPMHERNALIADGTPPPSPPPADPTGAWGTTAPGKPSLEFLPDGTMTGSDGCNTINGSWTQTDDGVILFADITTTEMSCDGVDVWLMYGRSAHILENYLYVSNADGGIIGGLMPAQ